GRERAPLWRADGVGNELGRPGDRAGAGADWRARQGAGVEWHGRARLATPNATDQREPEQYPERALVLDIPCECLQPEQHERRGDPSKHDVAIARRTNRPTEPEHEQHDECDRRGDSDHRGDVDRGEVRVPAVVCGGAPGPDAEWMRADRRERVV